MRRPRVYSPAPITGPGPLVLTGDRAHYLGRVLRTRPGDACVVFDGSGLDYPATISRIARHEVVVELAAPVAVANESPLEITLVLAVTRGSRMDVALQKSVELGATALVPVLTERCGVRLDPRQAAQRLAHWQGVVISAAEQCGRARLPAVTRPVPLGEALPALPPAAATRVVLEPRAASALDAVARPTAGVAVLVGPEGGLAAGEEAAAREHGFVGVRLGPRVLRAETAPLAVLAALQCLWGDLAVSTAG